MPARLTSFRKYQRNIVIENLIRDFQLQKPEKTFLQEMRDVFFSWLIGLGVPCLTILLVFILKSYYANLFADTPFLLFFSPIIVSSWIAGFYSGLIATMLGGIISIYASTPFLDPSQIGRREDVLFLIYLIEGIIMSYFISNQRKAKKQAEEIELSFQLLLANTTDYGILFFDKRGYILNTNRGVYNLTGYKKDDLKGRSFSLLFTREDRGKKMPEKEYIKALRKGKSLDENYLQRKNGTIFLASGFTTPLWVSDNQFYGFVKLFRDITESKRQEQEKEDFISIAAHELRNPVSSINLYLQLLQKYYQIHVDKEAQNYVKKASDQLQRLLDLITTLLDVSQIQKGTAYLNKESVDINSLIDDVIENIQSSEKRHRLIRRGHIKKSVMIDKRKIEEVIINLINNAIKYSPQAKRVVITVENKRKEISVNVTDFGIGMAKETAVKVFGRFYRGQQKQTQNIPGLGLGLYISSQIITAHRGKLTVTSRPGKGSTFSFTIPRA